MRNKHKRTAATLAAATLILGTALTGLAQDPPRARRNTRENITTLMLLRMTQVLDLTEEQTSRIFPVINRIEKDKLEINRRMLRTLRTLRDQLEKEKPNEGDLRSAMEEIRALRDQVKGKDAELEAFVMENLNLEQQARFLIFFQDFYRQLRSRLSEMRRGQQDRRPPNARRLPIRRPPRPIR